VLDGQLGVQKVLVEQFEQSRVKTQYPRVWKYCVLRVQENFTFTEVMD